MNIAEGRYIRVPVLPKITAGFYFSGDIPASTNIKIVDFDAEFTKVGKYCYEKHFRCKDCFQFIKSAYSVEAEGVAALKHFCTEPF